MTEASRTHRRLIVAATAAVLATVALVPFASPARAANVNSQATNITLTTPTTAATKGTCTPFTATVIPDPAPGDSYTVTVKISQNAAEGPSSTTIGFCDVSQWDPAAGPNPQPNPSTATGSADAGGFPAPGGGDGTASGKKTLCGSASSGPAPLPPTTVSCTATYSTDDAGKVTFGVTSDTPGTMTVVTYVDKNGNGAFDSNTDPNASATKTWVADDAGGISCAPASGTHPVNSVENFVCTVMTSGGTPGNGAVPVKFHITNGPDQGTAIYPCSYDTAAADKGNYGQYNCAYSNNGQAGTDTIEAWADVNNNSVHDSTEPTTQISATWGQAPASPPTITYTQPNKTAGQNVTFSGSTGSDSGTVTLEYKNATTNGAYKPLATVQGQNGQWTYTTPISYNTTVRASNANGSATTTVHVNVKVTITDIRYLGKDARGKCVTRFLGGTYPYIPGAPAWIRNSAVSPTQPIGFTRVFQFGSSGRYDARFGLNCGQTYRLFSLISGTGSNGVTYTDNGVGRDIAYKAGTTVHTGQ